MDSHTFYEVSNTNTRGHSAKLVEPRYRLDVRKLSFTHRVVEMWNCLEDRAVACDSVHSLKIDAMIVCTVEDLYKLFTLPSLENYYTILYYTLYNQRSSNQVEIM